MGYNPNCFDQNCKWNCCNAVGTCPADYQYQYYYNLSYSVCTHYYAIDAATIIGLGLGAALWIFIVVAILCCFVKLYPRGGVEKGKVGTDAGTDQQSVIDDAMPNDEQKLFMSRHGRKMVYTEIHFNICQPLNQEITRQQPPQPPPNP